MPTPRSRPRRQLTALLILALLALSSGSAPRSLLAQSGCTYAAELVQATRLAEGDAAAPDAPLPPDIPFTMQWTLLNDGSCTWDAADVRLILASGDRLDGPRLVRLSADVAPGESVTLDVPLLAPEDPGDYAATWRLRDPNGARFGPTLPVELTVGVEVTLAEGDVILPEVLVFSGRGGGGPPPADPCLDDAGNSPAAPLVVVDDEFMDYRQATLYVCSLDEGTAVDVLITNPADDAFAHTLTVAPAATYLDDDGSEYSQTVLTLALIWPDRAPDGTWLIELTAADWEATVSIEVLPVEPLPPSDFGPFPVMENWPVDPIDPVLAAQGCTYAYAPGQPLHVAGTDLLADATLQLGLYQERLGDAYLISAQNITTDADGAFSLVMDAPTTSGTYYLVTIGALNPEAYQDGGESYETGYEDQSAQTCLSVLPDPQSLPVRLAVNYGARAAADIVTLDIDTGVGYYQGFSLGECDATDPAWWPDGEFVVYATNCVDGPPDANGFPTRTTGSYDLYAHRVRYDWDEVNEETAPFEPIPLTITEDVDETEPHVDADGWIVMRVTPPGTDAEADGELWVLDPFEETWYDLGEMGRAPVWSPDSSAIAFMSLRSGRWQIYVYDLESQETRQVSTGCTTHCRFPAWSPDGQALLYSRATSRTDLIPSGIWLATLDGSARPREWLAGAYARPTWSRVPFGRGQVYMNGADGIYRVGEDGDPATLERYLYNRPDLQPYWAPRVSR